MEKYLPDADCIVMTRDQVRAFDQWAINTLGIPGVVLMENAGRSCAEILEQKLKDLSEPRVCIFCGTGNNGGDGYVIARHLLNAGLGVCVVVCGQREKIGGDARINLDVLERLGQRIELLDPAAPEAGRRVRALAGRADMVVDALFGTGLQGPLREDYRVLIEAINALGVPIVAVDIPSGLDCDTGRPLGAAIRAVSTVTFVAAKKGFAASGEAGAYTGQIYVASIGIEPPASG